MKAWKVTWCGIAGYFKAETVGRAKSISFSHISDAWDDCHFNDIRVRREPRLDGQDFPPGWEGPILWNPLVYSEPPGAF